MKLIISTFAILIGLSVQYPAFAAGESLAEVKTQIAELYASQSITTGDPFESQSIRKNWLSSPYGDSYPCAVEFASAFTSVIRNEIKKNVNEQYTLDLMRVSDVKVVGAGASEVSISTEGTRIQHIFEDNLRREPRIDEMVSSFTLLIAAESAEKLKGLLSQAATLCKP